MAARKSRQAATPAKGTDTQQNASTSIRRTRRSLLIQPPTTLSSPARNTPKRSSRTATIRNSSPQPSDLESDDMDLGGSYMNGPSRKTVVVEVPTMAALTKAAKSRQTSYTPSTVSEFSNEIDTPATSVAATPIESTSRKSLRKGAMNKALLSMGGDVPAATKESPIAKGKRKRTVEEDQVEDDEMLARALQDEEYAIVEPQDASSIKGKRELQIADSEDEDEDEALSDLTEMEEEDLSEESDFEPPSKKPRTTMQRGSTRHARGRPRQNATHSSKQAMPLEDQDDATLSSDDLSEFAESYTTESVDDDGLTGTAQGSDVQPRTLNRPFKRPHGVSRTALERAKLEHAHPEITTMWETLRDVPVIKPVKGPQPPGITRQLKSFQLEGVDWMRKQEASQWGGGLLGDEMGMGKTIQAVSLIMSDWPAKEPTLVLVPPVALMQWSSEINQYTDGKLKVLVHHNSDPKVKKLQVKDLKKYDVILISYSGLESMYRKESKGWKRDDGLVKENSRIHAIHYHRLILDEAHSIKSRTTGVAKACFALKGRYKWCLSGTPVQNRIGEFFSLLRFLEVRPFASYFCKKCDCAEIHWQQDERKSCTYCHHSGFQHVSVFNQEILNPITNASDSASRKEAFQKLRLITERLMLRRLKRDNTASMELPPKEVIVHNEFFGPIERDFSQSIMGNSARKFDTYVSRGVMLNNYANIFGLLMQMRQCADHPDLILKRKAEGGQNVLVCSICDEPAEEAIRSRCHHEFCRRCAKDYIKSFELEAEGVQTSANPDCPRCHIPLAIDFDQPDIEQDEEMVAKNSIINRIKMEDWTSSTKIEMLIYDLYKLRSKKQTHKSIVFSQFTSCLDLIDWRLRRAGFNTVKLDGSMTPAQRQKSVEYFMTNVDVEVFLVSLKAGGVALNLTEASRVFIVDPWWNPAAEWQSADRCHRIGQRRPCVITRLCIEDSVESRIIQLQAKKANMIAGTVDNDEVAMEKLSPEDMMFLFRGT